MENKINSNTSTSSSLEMLTKLRKTEIIGAFSEQQTNDIYKSIDEEAKIINKENRLRAIKATEQLRTIYITK